ncbi:MAG: FISUMP domain-containing protein [Candidatus Falkowbacteria bacterium]
MFKKNKKAFTLIELLVVIAIIGILATIAVVALQNARAKARDARRVADVKQMQTALELYFNDKQHYPSASEFTTGAIVSTSTQGTTTYMAVMPTPPSPADGPCSSTSAYTYSPSSDGNSYTIAYCLGGNVSALTPGKHCATPAGISDGSGCGTPAGDSFSCPGIPVVQYEGGPYDASGLATTTPGANTYYRTVKIGDQCWLRDNLNVGTMISRGNSAATGCVNVWGANDWSCQVNDNLVEKYCYNNDINNCVTNGGLYEWSEAMGFSYQCNGRATFTDGVSDCGTAQTYTIAAKHQGICPAGWHISSDSEQSALEQFLTDSGNSCDANRIGFGCLGAGTKLKVGGSSHFSSYFAGYVGMDGVFYDIGYRLFFWSTLPIPNNQQLHSWWRVLDVGNGGVEHGWTYKTNGYSVRCVKD